MSDPVVRLACLLLGTFACAWWLTGRVRRYALARSLMDLPNARSSHQVPTPRGGGLAIVMSLLLLTGALRWLDLLPTGAAIAVSVGGGLVALIGFIDDHGHVPARWRLLLHFAAAVTVLVGLGSTAVFVDGLWGLPGLVVQALAVVFLVWLLNLYNFMDGIDGLAGIEALTCALAGGFLLWLSGAVGLAALAWGLALASAGFLRWNFPPARIFMGDVGSGFVGLVLGALALASAGVDLGLFWAWMILLAVFVTDATLTLARRALRGERVHEAHRSHAYQRAARRFGSHARVTLAAGLINLLWLTPLAVLVAAGLLHALAGLVLAYGPLAALAAWLGAGLPDERSPSVAGGPGA
jgi:Fuc2NAc and GlcNAc transferase